MPTRARLPSGLRWRLTAWVAGVLVISAAIVFTVVYISTGSQIRSQVDRDIAAETAQLGAGPEADAGRMVPPRWPGSPRHMSERSPTASTRRCCSCWFPGAGTVSNHPEVFGAGTAERGETPAEQALENDRSRQLRTPVPGYSNRRIADAGQVRVLERRVTVAGVPVIVGAGEPLALVERAQHGVARAFVLAGAITLLLALVASYLAGARVTAPLRRLAAVASRVDAGELAPRMDPPAGAGNEVRVLALSFNRMLDRLEEAFAGQRAFVADASHELRTPLTVIRGQLEVLAASEDAPTREEVRRVERLLQAEVTRITRLVDDLLILAQAEQTDFLRVEDIDLEPFVSEIWDGLSLTREPAVLARRDSRRAGCEPTQTGWPRRCATWPATRSSTPSPTAGLVRLEVSRVGDDRVCFAVLDDGPGIAPEERERVFERFHRTDPARNRAAGGAGLGLAIVRAIAEAHGGERLRARPRAGPGARVELLLAGFAPA